MVCGKNCLNGQITGSRFIYRMIKDLVGLKKKYMARLNKKKPYILMSHLTNSRYWYGKIRMQLLWEMLPEFWGVHQNRTADHEREFYRYGITNEPLSRFMSCRNLLKILMKNSPF